MREFARNSKSLSAARLVLTYWTRPVESLGQAVLRGRPKSFFAALQDPWTLICITPVNRRVSTGN